MSPIEQGLLPVARALRAKTLSSVEATRICLDRIAATDPELAAFVAVYARAALKEAHRKDQSPSDAPFHGVPIAIKDLNFIRFCTTRFGSNAMPGVWSPVDDVTVSRLRKAGFVFLGKTATSELGVVPVTEPEGRPPTRNPWAPERTSGGSSGGAAAAVAAGVVPVSQGSDGGGSIRIPASFCGLVGLKAGRGRVPNHLGLRDPHIIYTCGALTRTVEDARAMLLVQGSPAPEARTGRLRVRVVLDVPLVETDPHIRAAIQTAAQVLADEGHEIDTIAPPHGTVDDFLPIWQHLFGQIKIARWSRAEPATRWLGEAGARLRLADVRTRQAELTERWGAWVAGCDVLLTPTVSLPPPLVGSVDKADGEAYFRAHALLGVWTAPFNVTGHPALSVPVGMHPLGTPIGAQLVGPMDSERTLLAVAERLEAALPLPGRPKVWAAG